MKTKIQKKNKENNIEKSLELSIIDNNLKNITEDFIELSIDSLLDDSVLKDIPIVGTVTNIYSGILNIKDKLFLKKVFSFLYQIKDIPSKDRKNILEKINNDKKYRIKIGEKLLYILDSCNDYESSEKIGKLFNEFLKGKINREEFEKIARILSNINPFDLDDLILNIKKVKEFFKKRKDSYFDEWSNKVSLEDVSHLLYLGVFDIYQTKPEVQIEKNDYPDGYKTADLNEYLVNVVEEASSYVELNLLGESFLKILDIFEK